ncbi:hypothetical protein H2200_010105 [Cladophialophora chaetospira]|uniref:Carboxylic ester hydrolase n=1 Tax=Cladophialophora chaetospira TaxID=386627 RepID=A0AA38X268_9EURO|nr:hypothetical protein H2200_010105 [Cladophialophora chaetospira]
MTSFRLPGLVGLVSLLCSVVTAQSNSTSSHAALPQVDLGYEVHQAISFNQTGQTYNFSNIRFAQPPIGNLRFAAPVPPTGRDPVVQNGSVGRVCPQAFPDWYTLALELEAAILTGNLSSYNYTANNEALQAYLAATPHTDQTDGRVTEDCLFLDVLVPKAVFDKRSSHGQQSGGAPVVVWIYGGGYVIGSKGSNGNPSGLVKASQANGEDGIIYVALNYRLGALGWLAGPTFQGSGGTANAGLYDQRLAIEWVAKYISLFGGDPKKITLLGESAGGGSIVHQITAFGGDRGVSFQRAITQSAGYDPVGTAFAAENFTTNYFSLLNVSTLAEARQKSTAEVILANTIQVENSFPYGSFTYGPMVDGLIIPELPGRLLSEGRFAKNISVMDGHNSFESASFTPPYLVTEADFRYWLREVYSGITDDALNYLLNTLYPAKYDGSQSYTTPLGRAFLMVQEMVFVCNTYYLNKAFNGTSYAYDFVVPPGFHAIDVPYTFYNGGGTNLTAGLIAPVALELQGYLVNFAMHGNPNGPSLPYFPPYGTNASMQVIDWNSTTQAPHDANNPRCAWWQKGLFA